MDADKDRVYWPLRREVDKFLRRQAHRRPVAGSHVERGIEGEKLVANWVRAMGYQVHRTVSPHPFDLWIVDSVGRAIRAEVKLSLYNPAKPRGGRFQAHVKNHAASLLIFIARNGRDWPFIIPMAAVAPRQNIAIWSYNPAKYGGQWAEYLKAWDYLHRAIEQAPPHPHQLTLLEGNNGQR